jgi:hypothetical protein
MDCHCSRLGFAAEDDWKGAEPELGEVEPEHVGILSRAPWHAIAGEGLVMEAIRKTVSSAIWPRLGADAGETWVDDTRTQGCVIHVRIRRSA